MRISGSKSAGMFMVFKNLSRRTQGPNPNPFCDVCVWVGPLGCDCSFFCLKFPNFSVDQRGRYAINT